MLGLGFCLIEFCDGVIRGCVERSAGVGIKGHGG